MLYSKEKFWLNTNETIKICKYIIVSLLIFNIVTLMILIHYNSKPPFVVRIKASGEATMLRSNDPETIPQEQEAVFFTENFLDKLLGYNHETLTQDLSIALSYMTNDLKQSHIESWKKTGSLDRIKRTKFSTNLYFGKIIANQDEYGDFIVHFNLASETAHEGGEKNLIPFQGHIMLKKVKRSMNNIYGLLVTRVNVEEA